MDSNEYMETDELSLSDIFRSVKRHLGLIIILTVLGGILAWAVSEFVIPERFVSTSQLYVDVQSEDNEPGTIGDLNYAARLLDTYIVMLDSRVFYEQVSEYFEPRVPAQTISEFITYSQVGNTEVFELRVTTTDPQLSHDLGSVVIDLAPDTIATLKGGAELKVVDPPSRPENPSSPNVMRNTLLGLIAGMFIGLAFAFLKEQLDQRIRDPETIIRNFDIQVLGQIPLMTEGYDTGKRGK